MATPQKAVTAVTPPLKAVSSSIENLDSLSREFRKGMLPRKLVMLKARLVELYSKNKINKEEKDLLTLILKKERSRGATPEGSYEVQVINQIEKALCTDKCLAISDGPPTHLITNGKEYSYYQDFEADRYVVYIDHLIKPEWQMTRELVVKEARGHFADESEYPKERWDIKRISINEKEFKGWFEHVEDLLSESKDGEEEYTF